MKPLTGNAGHETRSFGCLFRLVALGTVDVADDPLADLAGPLRRARERCRAAAPAPWCPGPSPKSSRALSPSPHSCSKTRRRWAVAAGMFGAAGRFTIGMTEMPALIGTDVATDPLAIDVLGSGKSRCRRGEDLACSATPATNWRWGMADAGLFIGWGEVVRGGARAKPPSSFRKPSAGTRSLQAEGTIESFEPVFLEPHGGDLFGFILIRGDAEKLAVLRVSQEFTQLSLRVGLIVSESALLGPTWVNGSSARSSTSPSRSARSPSRAAGTEAACACVYAFSRTYRTNGVGRVHDPASWLAVDRRETTP